MMPVFLDFRLEEVAEAIYERLIREGFPARAVSFRRSVEVSNKLSGLFDVKVWLLKMEGEAERSIEFMVCSDDCCGPQDLARFLKEIVREVIRRWKEQPLNR
jgi:hypothetical protein